MDPESNGAETGSETGQEVKAVSVVDILCILMDNHRRREEKLKQERCLREEERPARERELNKEGHSREGEHAKCVREIQEQMDMLRDMVVTLQK